MSVLTKVPPSTVASGEPGPLLPLLPGVDLAAFYAENTRCRPDPGFFGIYSIQPINGQLYLGFGTARPAEADGALVARTDGNTIVPVKVLPEQGFVSMEYNGQTLYVPGADPLGDWTAGDIFVGNPPDDLVLRRNLPNVVHSWGVHANRESGRIYVAVGKHTGDFITFTGGVFVSDDQGESWVAVEDTRHVLGEYRTYDVSGRNGWLYAIANDVYERPSEFVASNDQGTTWKRIGNQIESRPRLILTRDGVAALRTGGTGLAIADGKRVTRTKFAGFKAAEWAYNYMCVGCGGRYYLLAEGGRIYNSPDLRQWNLVAETGLNLLAIGYWPTKNWLIVADRGSGAGLYRMDLALHGAV